MIYLLSLLILFLIGVILYQVKVLRENNKKDRESQFAEDYLTSSTIEAMNDTYFLFNAETGKAIKWNSLFREQSGYNDEEIANLKAPESYYSPEDLKLAAKALEDVSTKGKAVVKISLICKNGNRIPFEYSVAKVPSSEDNLLISIGRDLSERRKAELVLQKERDFATSLVNTAQTIILVLDVEGKIVRVNPFLEELTGYSREEIEGKDWFSTFLQDQDHEKVRQVFKQAVNDIQTSGNINPICKKNGQSIDIEWYDKTLKDGEGNVIGLLAIGYDITQKRILEIEKQHALETAKLASKTKSEFLAIMSHEIRTPMNAIMGMGQLLKASSMDDNQIKYLDILMNASENLLALLNDVLDLSQLESKRIKGTLKPYHLPTLLDEALKVHQLSASDKDLSLSYIIDNAVPENPIGDAKRIRHVLLNLIGNAIKFTVEGSIQIHVSHSETNGIQFSVIDTGIGIPPEKLDMVFNPFTQVDSSITRSAQGTGLGLALCQRLVQVMDGKIWLESSPGKGSKFHFSLPNNQNPQAEFTSTNQLQSPSEVTSSKNSKKSDKQPSILLAEDSFENQIIVQAYLEKLNVALDISCDGDECFTRYKDKPYDMILMDIQMPTMDGYLATQKIREWEKSNDRKPSIIIALTAHALDHDKKRALEAGCDEFLLKPISQEILTSTIHSYLNCS